MTIIRYVQYIWMYQPYIRLQWQTLECKKYGARHLYVYENAEVAISPKLVHLHTPGQKKIQQPDIRCIYHPFFSISHICLKMQLHALEYETTCTCMKMRKSSNFTEKLMRMCTHLVKSRWQRGGEIDLVVNRAAPPMMLSKLYYTVLLGTKVQKDDNA